MAIILRFVDKNGFIKEHFFHVVHVRDTTTLTLKKEICAVLSRYNLHIENIRSQGYDGASNMRGEWNGLQALFLKECLYAYYVHCMAHRLQLALVKASREVKVVHQFFDYLTNIINIVVGSSKHNDELQYTQREQTENMIASNEIETGRGANQIEIIEIANILCQALQQHSQDLLNSMHLVSTTKSLIQKLRDDGWEPLLASVTSFCGQHKIDIPDLNARYTKARDFTEQEICLLKHQLQHYELDVTKHPDFQNMGTISELCRELEILEKSKFYHLIDRLIRLVLTIPVSTTTTERVFSAIKLLKTRLRNRMEDELLADNMIVYIEKEIAGNFTMEMIMDEFYSMKNRRQA
ncbi:hypothetical protein SO802_023042 [Lithocarpus litseifolius]|uniref:HAT C-terminal dimerisation domain-containing protein n=1 Tax=Lithocarpus litseifolius TaxID=425828 RepID=A0AAW2C561_9ROSI